jgi:hypothetical protein
MELYATFAINNAMLLREGASGIGAMTFHTVTHVMTVWLLINLLFVVWRMFPLPEERPDSVPGHNTENT